MSSPSGSAPPVPHTFREYLASFGPGIMVVLTWLGAGDIVEIGIAGGNYGYSLMWVLIVAVLMRFLFVSLIARYQLCNQHGEGVLDGLARLHPWYAPLLLAASFVMGHVYLAYMTVGTAETCRNLTGLGEIWQWALLWNGIAFYLAFRPSYDRLELVFKILLGLLSISFLGSALWVGFDPAALLAGLVKVEMPEQRGAFGPLLIAMGMVGAVGGSLMNLAYPYFLDAKGWRGAQYRRVQFYDFLLAIVVLLILNLSVWILGAELLYPDKTITVLDDLPKLLSTVLGEWGRRLFYLGIFAAIYTSVLGHAVGLAYMGSHAWLRHKAGTGKITQDYRSHPLYRVLIVWCLVSPLIWTIPGMPDFVRLTLLANSAQVVMLPLLAGGLWWITADAKYIGKEYRNRWWENVLMAFLFVLAVYSAGESVIAIVRYFTGGK